METTFNEIRAREIINIFDGKRLGRAQDIVFEKETGQVSGIVVPGVSKFLRKSDDIFIPIDKIKKIGDDVILVALCDEINSKVTPQENKLKNNNQISYARFRRTGPKVK